jgi:hypothetical protein
VVRFGVELQKVLWQEPRAWIARSNARRSNSWSAQIPTWAKNGAEVLRLVKRSYELVSHIPILL